jgi:hypothetical protein
MQVHMMPCRKELSYVPSEPVADAEDVVLINAVHAASRAVDKETSIHPERIALTK